MSGLEIILGGQQFNVDGSPWTMDITSGWWDGPEIDVELLPTINEGSALGRVMVRHRTVVCEGSVDTPDPNEHEAAHDVIESLVSVYNTTPLVVYETGGTKQLEVRAQRPASVRCLGRFIEFQLTLVATNPHKQPFDDEESS